MTASARAWLREANAERWHFIFRYEFVICSRYKNVLDHDIWSDVYAQHLYLQKEFRGAMATSKKKEFF